MFVEDQSSLERILVVRLDNIGDVLMLGPALRALRAAYPAARITVMTSPAGCHALPLLPWVDHAVAWRAVWQDASGSLALDPEREGAMVEELRRRRFDAAFVFTSFSQSVWPPAYACYLAGIPVRAGQARDFGGSLLTHRVIPQSDCTHQVERNLHLVESLGIHVPSRETTVRITREHAARADAMLQGVGIAPGVPFIAVAPSASCAARRYAPARFAETMRILAQRLRVPQLVVGGEPDTQVCAEVVAAAGLARTRSLVGRTSVAELAAVLSRARLLLANNSAPMHLAEAVHCPMVVMYSGTDLEEQWRPRDTPAILLRRPTPCEPCYRFECPYAMQCLDIPADEVAASCEEMWERTSHRSVTADTPDVPGVHPTTVTQGAA